MITPLLVFLNGGFGWVLLWDQAKQYDQGLSAMLRVFQTLLPIIPDTTWRWGNAISTLLVPQRGMLLGLPIAVIVFTQWWMATEDPKGTETGRRGDSKRTKRRQGKCGREEEAQEETARHESSLSAFPFPRLRVSSAHRMIAAGFIAGLLPLVHAHSFVAVMAVGGVYRIGPTDVGETGYCSFLRLRSWLCPQMWWSTHNSAVQASTFFRVALGWDRGKDNPVWFWLKNTGLFIPLTWRRLFGLARNVSCRNALLFFLSAFHALFHRAKPAQDGAMGVGQYQGLVLLVVGVRAYSGAAAGAPLASARSATHTCRSAICLCNAGRGVDVANIVLRSAKYQVFDRAGIQFAEIVKREDRAAGQNCSRSSTQSSGVSDWEAFPNGLPGHISGRMVSNTANVKARSIGFTRAGQTPAACWKI